MPRRPLRWRAWQTTLEPWLLPLALLAAWELSARLGWLSHRVLPEPLAVLSAFWNLLLTGELWQHVRVSTWRAFAGLALGGGLGLLLGLLTGLSRRPCKTPATGMNIGIAG